MKNDFLQNMAPNARRSVVVTLVFSAIATVLYMFAVEPIGAQLAQLQKKLDELESSQRRMNLDLKSADTIRKNLDEIDGALAPYRQAMLTPLLESYAMRAKSLLDPLMLGAGLSDLEYTDELFRPLPLPKPVMPRQLHTRAAIRIGAKGSYQAAISFLLRLEKEFPLVSVRTLDIRAQQSNSKQEITYVLEWPALGGLTRK